jgi:hypothetical protein
MINSQQLLSDLQNLLTTLEDDLRERCSEDPAVDQRVRAEFQRAREAQRTAQAYEVWRDEWITQVAVAYLLACVFVRFLEDNELVAEARLAGMGDRNAQAKDRHTVYFQQHPRDTDLSYLHWVFREIGHSPGAAALFDEKKNPVWKLELSPDGARLLVDFWRKLDPDSGQLVHDFTDPAWGTRFLGDLYQDLSKAARTKYALLQTPDFVEEFILDRTLDPALAEFGHKVVRLIDPACGSGHFLLGAFARIFKRWQDSEPGTNPRELAQRTLDAVCGVDLNPFAAAIARFRLLLAALQASSITRLRDAPAFRISVAAGDSLLHGPWPGTMGYQQDLLGEDPLRHVYDVEDKEELRRLLGRRYHVVVGNPPYIVARDPALSEAYRRRFATCHRQYSLAVPFFERFFELAAQPDDGGAGFVGMITSNSFMKREFGKKLIEDFIPRWDLTHIVDTSGAYIPGHGTPTVIIFGRQRAPVSQTVRAAMGIRGEPSTPQDPARGQVWSEIVSHLDEVGFSGMFVSVSDLERVRMRRHPWSIGGGGAADLKTGLEGGAGGSLGSVTADSGFGAVTREDECFLVSLRVASRNRVPQEHIRPLVAGEDIRDWAITNPTGALWPYDPLSLQSVSDPAIERFLWPWRPQLSARVAYGMSQLERGLRWSEYSMFFRKRFRTPLSITWAFVATHNHFVLDRGGKVFKQSAPVLKLKPEATEDDHLGLLGILNSSTACFWMKQVFFNKGSTVDQKGARQRTTPFEDFWEHDATKLANLPLPAVLPTDRASLLDSLAGFHRDSLPDRLLVGAVPDEQRWAYAAQASKERRLQMIALQEDLDWFCYRAYQLLDDDLTFPTDQLPPVALGERAFEIVMARKMATGELQTSWFDRHGSKPITEVPARWPAAYRQLVERRIAAIESNPNIRLIEQPEYKRRWNDEPWDEQQERALRNWLLDRIEAPQVWSTPKPVSCARLADRLRDDHDFMQVAALYRGHPDFDVTNLVVELAAAEAVPYWAPLRYTAAGLRKRQVWERTWDLQRHEDAIDVRAALPANNAQHLSPEAAQALKAKEVGKLAPPPKYANADFLKGSFWHLRGKLDVPKERFIAYPGAERGADTTPVIGWAGWDHLRQAQALATHYLEALELESWPVERLLPLLAGLLELVPWLKQWHNDLDPTTGERMGDYFESFVAEHARRHGTTIDGLRELQPIAPAKKPRRTNKAAATEAGS